MTDDMIEAVARAIEKSLVWDVERDIYASETTIEERRKVARAAIRSAAPLILDMAAKEADSFIEDDPLDTAEAISSAIHQLKERFQ